MARAFDTFAFLTLMAVVTGGWVFRSPHFFLDVSSADSFAVATLILLMLAWKKIQNHSRILPYFVKANASHSAIHHAKSFYGAVFGVLFCAHVAKHWSLQTNGFDVSFVHQALFHPFATPFFPADISPSGSALGEHLLFSLVPLSLFTQYFRFDELIFLIQSLAIGVPLYILIFKNAHLRQLKQWIWVPIFVVLSNSSLRHSLIFDFREDAFAFSGLVLAGIALQKGRVKTYVAGLLLALLSKEYVFLITLPVTLVILFSKDLPFSKAVRLRLAIFTAVISFGYGFVAFRILIPFFNPGLAHGSSPIVARLHQFGDTPFAILQNVMVHPANWWIVAKNILTRASLIYLAKMLIPWTPFLFVEGAWVYALPAFFGIGLNILTGYPGQTSMQFHYDLIVLPFLFAGGLLGMSRAKWNAKKAFACVLLALSFSGKWPLYEFFHFFPSGSEANARIAMLNLNRAIPVLTDTRLSAQVNQHEKIVILDENCQTVNQASPSTYTGYVIEDQRDLLWTRCKPDGGTLVFGNSEIKIYTLGLKD